MVALFKYFVNRKKKSDEVIFLTDVLKNYLKWKGRNEEYAESYRVILNAYTAGDK